MPSRRRLWLLLPRPLRALPADLVAVVLAVGLTGLVVFLPVLDESPVRVVAGLVFVLFVPGYAFVAALFPEAGRAPTADEGATVDTAGVQEDRGIDGVERIALSFGLSIAIVPLLGLALNFTPFGIRLLPIMATLGTFTLVATAVAAERRRQLPSTERFTVPYREWLAAGRDGLFNPGSTVDAALNVALVVAIVLALSSVVYAVAVPPQGEQFSEFYVLTEDQDDELVADDNPAELVADDYPGELVAGEPATLHVGIGNDEYETVQYTVVAQLQQVEGAGNESTVTDRTELDRWTTTLAHNETGTEARSLGVTNETAAEFAGEDRRLALLLYRGDPAPEPARENAYRDLNLWMNVSTGAESP